MRSRARSLAVSVGAAAIMSAAVIVAIVGQPSTALVGTTTSRIAGADRYQTAAQIATATFSHVNTVVLASGQNFPDGLAASGLAGADNAPVLLTPTAQLSSASANAIAALGAHNVIIVGGANAVSTGVQNQLTGLGYTVTRIAGSDRYATAAMVADAMTAAAPVGAFNGLKSAFVATGTNFPDALGAAAPAFARHIPILLTDPNSLSTATSAELTKLGVKQAIILGAFAAVSSKVETSIKALPGISTIRIFGANRFATAAQLAGFEWAPVLPGPSFDFQSIQAALPVAERGFVELTSGINFPDAEAVGPRAGTLGAAIMLDDPLPAESKTWLGTYQSNIGNVEAIGGTNAVSAADLTAAQTAATGSAGTATITAIAGETAFSVGVGSNINGATEVPSSFTVNNQPLPAGATCGALQNIICTGLSQPLKAGDVVAVIPGALTTTTGQAFTAAPFTVPAPSAPTVTDSTFAVGASDFNVTFSRPIACTVPAPPNPPCSAWPIFNGTVVLSGGQGITLKATNQGNSFVATATPFPTSFTFQLSSPITTGETVTLTTGITDNSTPALPMAHDVVIAATPDNVAPKPQTVVAQQVTQAPLYVLGSATVGGISLTAKLGSPTDGGGWNSFWVQVVTEGPNQFTTVQSNSNCTSSMASQYCVTIYTGGLPGGALTNALTADPIFTSLFVGSANGGASDAGPTHLAGGKTGLAVALVLNKPIDPIAAAGLGTYSLDVFGDGALTANDFIVEAVDNPAAPTILAVVFSLTNFGVTLPPTAKLNVVNAPVSFAGLALTPSSIAIP